MYEQDFKTTKLAVVCYVPVGIRLILLASWMSQGWSMILQA